MPPASGALGSAITRRGALAATSAAVAARALPSVSVFPAQPNILFIMADDLGWGDPSCYGNTDFETPGVDRLANEGLRLTNAYANSCVCSATRIALITGRYQYRLPAGLQEPITDKTHGLPGWHPTLPSLLRRKGYRTALVGKWHLGAPPAYSPLKSGYDEFFGIAGGGVDYFTHKDPKGSADLYLQNRRVDRTGYLTELLTKYAEDYLTRQARGALGAPFFLSLHYTAPHWPWESETDQAESARIKNLFHIDGGSLRTFAAMVKSMDAGIGRLLALLDELHLTRNTIVVFTSDNGGERFSRMWPLMGEKGDLLEGGIRVPAIVRYPGRIAAGTVSDQVVVSMDWLPTLLTLASASPDPRYPPDGKDLSLHLADGPLMRRRLYWRFKGKQQAAMRDGDFKYLKRGPNEFLFNVVEDPRERANLATVQKTRFKRMKASYAAWNRTMLKDRGVEGYQLPLDWLAI